MVKIGYRKLEVVANWLMHEAIKLGTFVKSIVMNNKVLNLYVFYKESL